MKALRKAISPDVVIVDDWQPTEINKELVRLSGKGTRTFLEDKFIDNWEALGGPTLTREYRFHEVRKWRFDFAHVPTKVAFEIMGGLYNPNSGHRSQAGVSRDYEKANAATSLGWRVFSVTSKDLQDETTMRKLVEVVMAGASMAGPE